MRLSRRQLIGLAAGALVPLAGGGVWRTRGVEPAIVGLRHLDGRGYRTAQAMAQALFPPGPGEADDSDRLARALDGWLADEPAHVQTKLGQALLLLELGPVLQDPGRRRLDELAPAERQALLQTWMDGQSTVRRQAVVGLRRFFALLHYDQPAAWGRIGYDGTFAMRSKP